MKSENPRWHLDLTRHALLLIESGADLARHGLESIGRALFLAGSGADLARHALERTRGVLPSEPERKRPAKLRLRKGIA